MSVCPTVHRAAFTEYYFRCIAHHWIIWQRLLPCVAVTTQLHSLPCCVSERTGELLFCKRNLEFICYSQVVIPCLPTSRAAGESKMATSQIRQNYSAECEAAINKQINIELHASYVYQSMVCLLWSSLNGKYFISWVTACGMSHMWARLKMTEKAITSPDRTGGKVYYQSGSRTDCIFYYQSGPDCWQSLLPVRTGGNVLGFVGTGEGSGE